MGLDFDLDLDPTKWEARLSLDPVWKAGLSDLMGRNKKAQSTKTRLRLARFQCRKSLLSSKKEGCYIGNQMEI